MLQIFSCFVALLASASLRAENSIPKIRKVKSVRVYGYPSVDKDEYQLGFQNGFQPEQLSTVVPGLVIAKLGGQGQATSLRYQNYASGDLSFLYDGFEISDSSDPSEGFSLSNLILSSDVSLDVSSQSSGFFSRQLGGQFSLNPKVSEGIFFKSAFGSQTQTFLSTEGSGCVSKNCYSFGLGASFVDALSASLNSNGNQSLENDFSRFGYLNLGYLKKIKPGSNFKIRTYSQISATDIDDYDANFIFKDDPNAELFFRNYFFGASYLESEQQYFLETTYSQRQILNFKDQFNSTSRDEEYEVLRTKLRAEHYFRNFDFYWSLQNLNLKTVKETNEVGLDLIEASAQFDYHKNVASTNWTQSLSVNLMEHFKETLSYSHQWVLKPLKPDSRWKISLQYGYKERRPSVFQLFDPQFGNPDLDIETLTFFRPEIQFNFLNKSELSSDLEKHNISLQLNSENLDSRVVFQNTGVENGYSNSQDLSLNSVQVQYFVQWPRLNFSSHWRQALDSKAEFKSLPWSSRSEWGTSLSTRWKKIQASLSLKQMLRMYTPSGTFISALMQSQMQLSYQPVLSRQWTLAIDNLFQETEVWDVGFRRQGLTWLLSLSQKL